MIGTSVKQYRILELLGSGGMGAVYRAVDTRLDRDIALKFLPPHLSTSEAERTRFIREAKAASALDHPNICTVHEIGEAEDGRLFISMACYEGESLRDRLRRGPIPIDEALDLAIQVGEGLTAAHSKGIVHRDIKPANLLVTLEGRIKIVDFGLAKSVGTAQLTKTGSTIGTAAYMSPEQARGDDVGSQTDIWSLGVVLYEMLTGKRPFRGEFEAAMIYSIVNQDPDPPSKHDPSIPPELERILLRALQKEPDERYASVEELVGDLSRFQSPHGGDGAVNLSRLSRQLRRPIVAIPAAIVVLIFLLGSAWLVERRARVQWARDEALPKIEKLMENNWSDFTDVYELAVEAARHLPNDPKLQQIIAKTSLEINVETEPPGAAVYVKEFDAPETEWQHLGSTPLQSIRMPVGVFRWKLEKTGYASVLAASSSWDAQHVEAELAPFHLNRKLDEASALPEGMIRVENSTTDAGDVPDFFIDRYEVTNQQYKAFVDAGGYQTRDFWEEPFVKKGRTLTWEEAVAEFVDQTGRPSPSTWVAGDFPEGEQNHPVTGVSWYEAVAYAKFAGKRLPTSHHWGLARGEAYPMIRNAHRGGMALYAPISNFGDAGTVPVGSLPAISPFGAYDMAGNVREWCWNESPEGRIVRGGAWNDPVYMFGRLSQAPPFDRSQSNGFRLVVYPDEDSVPAAAFQPITFREQSDLYAQRPVGDAAFQIYEEQFAYDPLALNPEVEFTDDSHEDWIRQRITIDAPYDHERIVLHVFLPKTTDAPYQAVLFVPGGSAFSDLSSDDIESGVQFASFLSFVVKNGRAVVIPVYKGTFERRYHSSSAGTDSHTYTERIRKFVKDFSRSIDYLESRPDIDSTKIGYYGLSWGGGDISPVITATEDRLDAVVLVGGGILGRGRPEVNPINYLPRVQSPTLMLNGKYDTVYPYETTIKPMFDLLGTPDEHKEMKLYETDHVPPRNDVVKEALAWFDRYLGTVR